MAVKLSGMSSNLDTESIVKALVSAYSITKDNLVKSQTKLSWKQDSWKSMNKSIYNFYSKNLTNMKLSSSYIKKTSSVSDATIAKVTSSSSAVSGTQSLKVKELASSGYLTGSMITSEVTKDGVTTEGNVTLSSKLSEVKGLSAFTTGGFTVGVGTKSTNIEMTSEMTISQLVNKLKESGVNASFDEKNKRFYISSKASGAANDFTLTASNPEGLTALESMGITESKGAVKLDGSDAQIILNGATFTSTTNNFDINGLTIQAINRTADTSSVTITTDTDVDGIYNMIKGFFKEYNTLVNGMDAAYNASNSKGYEPLTTEEKDAMTDTEVEAWEKKIKDSLLRKDTTLNGVSGSLKTKMLSAFTINDKKYSLATFGVKTLSYFTSADNEKGAFHIDGDTENTNTSGNPDKLRAAIASDPEAVVSFFTKLSSSVYDDLTDRMKSSTLRSAYTIYNDKQMGTEYSEYNKKISKWEEKVSVMEEYYNRKFTAMEKALATLNSNSSSLSSLLGS